MRYLLLILFFLSTCAIWAADPKYPVSSIPDELKKNMYGVVREQITEYKILGRNKFSEYNKEVITILNAKGKDLAEKAIHYDPFKKISYIRATVYDARGVQIKKLKPSEIYDRSSYDGFSLYHDNRVKIIDLTQNVYPYTIELEYEIESKYLYSFSHVLYYDDEVSLQKSAFNVIYPKELEPRYKLMSAPQPTKTTEGGVEKLSWNFSNVVPFRWERFTGDFREYVPTILVGPVEFEYANYSGRMDTWENYGKWIAMLNKDRDQIPEKTKQYITQLTQGKSDEEKVKLLYSYLQSKTRYVSIQLGIGGLQPFEAKVVDQVGYGDCKALSNYMVSMLKEVGIKAHYTLIMAGENARDVVVDFPAHQANHAIVAVPMGKDTVWLECTSQTNPYNYLGTFTGNRYALMITDDGGKLVKTPSYDKGKNLMVRNAVVTLLPGKADAIVKTVYHGVLYDKNHVGAYTMFSADEQKKWIQKNTQIASFDIQSFAMKSLTAHEASASVEMNLTLPNYATVTGKRLFLVPNLMNRVTSVPEKTDNRKTKVEIKYPYTDIDSIQYNIPEEIYPEFLPERVHVTSRFGEYEASFLLDQGKVLYVRKLRFKSGTFPADSYQELVDFYKAINKADNIKLVFLTKT